MGSDAQDIGLTIHPHPTLSETVGFAGEMAEGTITDLMAPRRPAQTRSGATQPAVMPSPRRRGEVSGRVFLGGFRKRGGVAPAGSGTR